MAFTYSPGTDRGRVRLHIGDTVAERAVYTDAEIDDALSTEGSVAAAALMLARAMLMRAGRTARNYSTAEGSVDDTAGLAYVQAMVERLEAAAAQVTPSASIPLAEVTALGAAPNDPFYIVRG